MIPVRIADGAPSILLCRTEGCGRSLCSDVGWCGQDKHDLAHNNGCRVLFHLSGEALQKEEDHIKTMLRGSHPRVPALHSALSSDLPTTFLGSGAQSMMVRLRIALAAAQNLALNQFVGAIGAFKGMAELLDGKTVTGLPAETHVQCNVRSLRGALHSCQQLLQLRASPLNTVTLPELVRVKVARVPRSSPHSRRYIRD